MKTLLDLLRRLTGARQRHYPAMWDGHQGVCNCGYHSPWDWDLKQHFAETGWIGQ